MSELVEYIIVNKDLDMSPGKIAAQVAHIQTKIDAKAYQGELELFEYRNKDRDIKDFPKLNIMVFNYFWWLEKVGQTKIILKGSEKQLLRAIELGAVSVRDKGLTEIEPNSLTAVGFMPQPKSNMAHFTKRLRLL